MRIKRLPNGRYQVRWDVYVLVNGEKVRDQRSKNFRTKEQAQDHCRALDRGEYQKESGKPIREIVAEWRQSSAWENLDFPTQLTYQRTMERWFDLIDDVAIGDLDPARVSKWIADLKANADRYGRAKQRQSFTKELDVLKSLVAWYREHKDDGDFISPIRKRHADEAWIGGSHVRTEEDFSEQVSDEIPLTDEEYERFRAELGNGKFGEQMQIIADTQFDHSLRVCEVAAVMWPDFRWASEVIKFQRHVQYMHQKRKENLDRIVPGLKNRKAVKRRSKRFARRQALSKTNPFFPRSTKGLRELYLKAVDKAGLVFVNPETGSFFSYKCIKDKYDRAFKRAGLPYTGTHIVRYGGVNDFIERYDADEKAAMELLGNESEGRYILRRPSKVAQAIKSKEPRASNVHEALCDSGNFAETRDLSRSGGMDGVTSAAKVFPMKSAQ